MKNDTLVQTDSNIFPTPQDTRNNMPRPHAGSPFSVKKRDDPVTLALIALFVILSGTLIVVSVRAYLNRPSVSPIPLPTPTATPTPTPIRVRSSLASQSAFLTLDANIASLSADIRNYEAQDPSLSPPVLTLPLGFPN